MSKNVESVPQNAEQLKVMLSDPAVLAEHFETTEKAGKFLANFAKAAMDGEAQLRIDLEADKNKSLVEMAREMGTGNIDHSGGVAVAGSDKGAGYSATAPGVMMNDFGGSTSDFFKISLRDESHLSDEQIAMKEVVKENVRNIRMAYGTTVPSEGGFVIPETTRSDIMTLALERNFIRQGATVIPLSGGRLEIPISDDSSNAQSGSNYPTRGGITSFWDDESEAATESAGNFKSIGFDPKKLTTLATVPEELLDDSPAFMAWLSASMPENVAWTEEFAFIEGDGVKRPKGFKNATATITVDKEPGQPNNTIVYENLLEMMMRLMPDAIGKAIWIANHDCMRELATIALSVGTGGSGVWMNDAKQGVPNVLVGRPLIFTEKMEGLGASGDIMLVDLSSYIIGDRQAAQLTTSTHSKFVEGQVQFKITSRLDGQPGILNARLSAKSGKTVSPFVKLEARSA